jgi:hypothetical protein
MLSAGVGAAHSTILSFLLGRVAMIASPPLGVPVGLSPFMEGSVDLNPSIFEEGD